MVFFFADTAPSEIYTLSLHDALPILHLLLQRPKGLVDIVVTHENLHAAFLLDRGGTDRKSTRLNSSHRCISYAVFCLKKKKQHAGQNPRAKAQAVDHGEGRAGGRGAR